MNSEELLNKLKEIEEKENELNEGIRSLKKLKREIYEYLNRCSMFDESIIILISHTEKS